MQQAATASADAKLAPPVAAAPAVGGAKCELAPLGAQPPRPDAAAVDVAVTHKAAPAPAGANPEQVKKTRFQAAPAPAEGKPDEPPQPVAAPALAVGGAKPEPAPPGAQPPRPDAAAVVVAVTHKAALAPPPGLPPPHPTRRPKTLPPGLEQSVNVQSELQHQPWCQPLPVQQAAPAPAVPTGGGTAPALAAPAPARGGAALVHSGMPVGPADKWSINDMETFVEFIDLGHLKPIIKEKNIDGQTFLRSSEEDVEGIGPLQWKKIKTKMQQ